MLMFVVQYRCRVFPRHSRSVARPNPRRSPSSRVATSRSWCRKASPLRGRRCHLNWVWPTWTASRSRRAGRTDQLAIRATSGDRGLPSRHPPPHRQSRSRVGAEVKHQQLQETYTDIYCQVSDARFKLYGFLRVLGDEVMRRPEVKAAYRELHDQLEQIRYKSS